MLVNLSGRKATLNMLGKHAFMLLEHILATSTISTHTALNDSLMMGKTLYNMGIMYYDQQVYDSTKVYLQKTIQLFDKYPDIQVRTYRLLALCCYLKSDNLNAFKNLEKGVPLFKIGDNDKYSYLYNILYGVIYKNGSNHEKALDYFHKNMANSRISEIEKLRNTLYLVDVYLKCNEMDSATYYKK